MAAEKARKKRSGQSPRKNPFKGTMRRDRELRRFLRSGDGITIHTEGKGRVQGEALKCTKGIYMRLHM